MNNRATFIMQEKEVRAQLDDQRTPLFINLLYKYKVKVFVAELGLKFKVRYDNLAHAGMSYDGLYAFVKLPDEEIILCKLKLGIGSIYSYTALEVPGAYRRIPAKRATIDECQILGYLAPC